MTDHTPFPAMRAATRLLLMPNRPDSIVWRTSLVASGCLLLLLGAVSLLAWSTGNLEYLQIEATLPPMHYNAALAFIVWAVAYFALAGAWDRLARALAVVMIGFGAIVAVAGIPGLELGLDRWAFDLPHSGPRFPPGGAAPAMAFGLTLSGLAVSVAARREVGALHAFLGTFAGIVLVVGSPTALIVAHTSNPGTQSSGATVLGAIGATIAGLGLMTSAFRRGSPSFALGRTLPMTVGITGIALTFALWASLKTEQNRRIHRQVQFEAAHVHQSAQEQLRQEMHSISVESERVPRSPQDETSREIKSYIDARPSCIGIARINANLKVNWIETQQLVSLPTTLGELGLADALSEATRTGRVAVARPLRSFWRGARVLVIFSPHPQLSPPAGGLIGVYRCQEFFDTAVNANVAAGYGVSITEKDEPLFARYAADDHSRGEWEQSLPLVFEGFDWRIAVWPTSEVLERESLSLPRLALLIGLLTAGLLALAVHLAQTARRRTFALENEVRERKLAEQALKQSEEKYRSLIENLGQGIFLQDREHRYVAANAQFCRGVGRSEAEIVGATDADLFERGRAASHAEEVATVLAEGKSVESEEELVVGGRRAQVRRVLTPVRDAAGRTTGVLGICWDVTEQRRFEAHVHQASKMDAIGQLAGGIAHDFNNLLTVILGNLELIREGLPAGQLAEELVTSAQNAATRAASLTQRLLGFSRRHQLDWVSANLNTIIDEVVSLLRRTIDPLIRIETRFAPDLWPVQADPVQLNQVLMNLCLNARDAIAGAGQITIETTCASAAEVRGLKGLSGRNGEFVRLRVTDSGSGMTDEVRARIYEPFFTTKAVGKGTGLGLPMVFAIVRQHKGWIDCWSEPGRGTRFDIYLPRGESVKTTETTPTTPAPSREGKETILVVDDEELIRKLAASALQSHGYQVLEAADGQQAVDAYSREGDRIALVVLDLTMPTLSGHEAFRHLLKLNPRVRVLFASGYAVEQLSDLEKEMMAGFLKKPYRPNELILAVEEALQPSSRGKRDGSVLPFLHPSGQFRMPLASA